MVKIRLKNRILWVLALLITWGLNAAPSRKLPIRKPAAAETLDLNSRILVSENLRELKSQAISAALKSQPNPTTVKLALRAVGRIKDGSFIDEIAKFLSSRDASIRELAALALGLIGGEVAPKVLQQNLMLIRDGATKEKILTALGIGGRENTLAVLQGFLTGNQPPNLVEASARAIGQLWSVGAEKWKIPPGMLPTLGQLSSSPQESVALSAAFALSRFPGDPATIPVSELVTAASKSKSPAHLAFLVKAVGKVRSTESKSFLLEKLFSSPEPSVKIEAARALGAQAYSLEVEVALKKAMGDSHSGLVVMALHSLQKQSAESKNAFDAVLKLFETATSPWVKGTALVTLAKLDAERARPLVSKCLTEKTLPLYSVPALAHLGAPKDLDKMAEYLSSAEPAVGTRCLNTLTELGEERITGTLKAAIKNSLSRGDHGITAAVAEVAEKFRWKDFASALTNVLPLMSGPERVETRKTIYTALAKIGDRSHLPVLRAGLKDPERECAYAAAEAIKQISGEDVFSQVPLNSVVSNVSTPSWTEAQKATRARVILTTRLGKIRMEMLDSAPLTAFTFVSLARRGFYDGLTFHRVVPHFVAQGGDPHGDGYGGPGFLIRDEVSFEKHSPGTVGIATAGRDTGGSQFFFDNAYNFHLVGKYTAFAEITEGRDFAEKLEEGDKILSVQVL